MTDNKPIETGEGETSIHPGKRKKVAVLISGRGSNMAALIAASMKPDYPAIITKVISSKHDAEGLQIAASNNIATAVADRKDFDSAQAQEEALLDLLSGDEPDFICLAGYMRILSERFVHRFKGRILNIHPSLLPAFKGLDTHHRAIANGVCLHGCTVHYVSEVMDEGPIIAQAAVPVLPGDDDETLAARVLQAEHRLYPAALRMVAENKVRLSAGHTVFSVPKQTGAPILFSPFEGEIIAK